MQYSHMVVNASTPTPRTTIQARLQYVTLNTPHHCLGPVPSRIPRGPTTWTPRGSPPQTSHLRRSSPSRPICCSTISVRLGKLIQVQEWRTRLHRSDIPAGISDCVGLELPERVCSTLPYAWALPNSLNQVLLGTHTFVHTIVSVYICCDVATYQHDFH